MRGKCKEKIVSYALAVSLIFGTLSVGNAGTAKAAKSVSLNHTKLTLNLKTKKTAKLNVKKASGITIKKITYKSNNKKIAKVTGAGKVTAKGAGNAKITVKVKYKKKKKTVTKKLVCRVTVKKNNDAIIPTNSPDTTPIPSENIEATPMPSPTIAPTVMPSSTVTPTVMPTETSPEGSFFVDFSKQKLTFLGLSDPFMIYNGWNNGDGWNVTWRSDNVTFENGKMQLILDEDKNPENGRVYSGATVCSRDITKGYWDNARFGYGRYEVSMKAIKCSGVVSSFFTYNAEPYSEIDVEILGKDPTKVWLTHWINPAEGHGVSYDLGFDSSENFHTYAFEWHKNEIDWYVDGKKIYTVNEYIPQEAAAIAMNVWCSTGTGWVGEMDASKVPVRAEYEWVRFIPFSE